jgi:hypothetical protein
MQQVAGGKGSVSALNWEKMMKDEVMAEVWKAKDAISAEHHYDVKRLVAHLPLSWNGTVPTMLGQDRWQLDVGVARAKL